MYWICIRQRRACTEWMQHLCLLCFWWVDHSQMLSDKLSGLHHRQVSSCVLYKREHPHYAVEGYSALTMTISYHYMPMCQTGPLDWTCLGFDHIFISSIWFPLPVVKKRTNLKIKDASRWQMLSTNRIILNCESNTEHPPQVWDPPTHPQRYCPCTTALFALLTLHSVTFCGMRWRINEIAMALVLRIDCRLSEAAINNP